MTTRTFPIVAIAVALAFACPASAVVSNDLHWVRERSPISLYSLVVIDSLGSLTIDPGVEVRFRGNASLVVQGRLTVLGTSSLPVRFVPMTEGERWGGISVQGGDALIQGVELRGAVVGIEATGGATILAQSLVDDVEDACLRVGSGARVTVVETRFRHGALGVEAEDGSLLTLRACEIAHVTGAGLLVQPGASVTAETCAFHDDGIGVDVADAEALVIGRVVDGVLRGGACLFSCNGLDVVNRTDGELAARGNTWTSASRREGLVDASDASNSVDDALRRFDRLFVGKDGGEPSFVWESLGDCAEHVVMSSGSPGTGFAEGPAPADAPVVFYRMVTRLD